MMVVNRSKVLDRLIIGISGASGVQYGVRALELLQAVPIETHLIMSKSAELTVHHELDCSVDEIRALADVWHPVRNVGASVASGSFQTRGMLLAPCSNGRRRRAASPRILCKAGFG